MMGSDMFDFSTVTGSTGQMDNNDPGDLMGLSGFLGKQPPEEPIDLDTLSPDPLDHMPGDILGEQIFKV